MASPVAKPSLPPADEAAVRAHLAELRSLAAGHGIVDLRFASPGRLVGHVADDRDLFDVFAFQRGAQRLLGAKVELFSDAVLMHAHARAARAEGASALHEPAWASS